MPVIFLSTSHFTFLHQVDLQKNNKLGEMLIHISACSLLPPFYFCHFKLSRLLSAAFLFYPLFFLSDRQPVFSGKKAILVQNPSPLAHVPCLESSQSLRNFNYYFQKNPLFFKGCNRSCWTVISMKWLAKDSPSNQVQRGTVDQRTSLEKEKKKTVPKTVHETTAKYKDPIMQWRLLYKYNIQ